MQRRRSCDRRGYASLRRRCGHKIRICAAVPRTQRSCVARASMLARNVSPVNCCPCHAADQKKLFQRGKRPCNVSICRDDRAVLRFFVFATFSKTPLLSFLGSQIVAHPMIAFKPRKIGTI